MLSLSGPVRAFLDGSLNLRRAGHRLRRPAVAYWTSAAPWSSVGRKPVGRRKEEEDQDLQTPRRRSPGTAICEIDYVMTGVDEPVAQAIEAAVELDPADLDRMPATLRCSPAEPGLLQPSHAAGGGYSRQSPG